MKNKAIEKNMNRVMIAMHSTSTDESDNDKESDEDDQLLMSKEDNDSEPEGLLTQMTNSDCMLMRKKNLRLAFKISRTEFILTLKRK